MPLLKLEYTANIGLENKQWGSLFVEMHQLVADTVSADVAACKSRWSVLHDYCVGDGSDNQGYVLLVVQVLSGRPVAQRLALKSALTGHLADFFRSTTTYTPAVRVYVTELESEFYGMA